MVGVLRACLDGMKNEWYHSVFMIHHPNLMGPTVEHLFGWVLSHCFPDSNTQKNGCGWWKMKTGFWCFQNLKTETQWQVV